MFGVAGELVLLLFGAWVSGFCVATGIALWNKGRRDEKSNIADSDTTNA